MQVVLTMCAIVLQNVGDNLVWNHYSHRVDAEVKFYKYKFQILILRGVLKATQVISKSCQLVCTKCWIALVARVTRIVKHINFRASFKKCGIECDLMSCFSCKTVNIFLAHFRSLKKLQIFTMLLVIMYAAPLLPKSTLISSYR